MQAAVSLDMAQIAKYVAYLQWLALFTLIMRILWVVDITQEVQKVVDDSHNGTLCPLRSMDNHRLIHHHYHRLLAVPSTTGGAGSGGGSTGSGSGSAQSQEPLDQNTVDSYTFQVFIFLYLSPSPFILRMGR